MAAGLKSRAAQLVGCVQLSCVGLVLPGLLQVVLTTRRADIHWQNGTVERGVPSKDLLPVNNVDEHDFWPNVGSF